MKKHHIIPVAFLSGMLLLGLGIWGLRNKWESKSLDCDGILSVFSFAFGAVIIIFTSLFTFVRRR